MAATVGETIRKVRSKLHEPAPERWQDYELREWINEAQRDVARRMRWYNREGTVSAVAGTQEYNLPADCFMVTFVTYKPTGTSLTYPLTYVDRRNLRAEAYTWYETTQSIPWNWSWRGYPGTSTFKLIVYPSPSDAGDFIVDYYGIPADHTVETDTDNGQGLTVPEGFESLVTDFVVAEALLADGRQEWEVHKNKYEQAMTELEEARHGTDQSGQILNGPWATFDDESVWV